MRFLFIVFIAVFISSCTQQQGTTSPTSIVSTFKPLYAKGFEIQQLSDSSKVIILFNLEKPGDTLQKIHWKPTDVKSIACVSTTHIVMLDKLGRLNDLKGVGFADMVRNKNTRVLIDKGEIVNLSTGHDIDAEVVYGIQPQLLFVYPFGGNNYDKYLKRGIGCVQVSEYLETHPLGRAEWVKLFGVLLGEEQKADSVFNYIKNEYNSLKLQIEKTVMEKPTVFSASYSNGNWFAPPGNSFAAQFIVDAGGNYIFSDSLKAGNIVLPFEAMYERVYDVDYWGKIIFEPGSLTLDKIKNEDSRLTQIKSFKNKNIFYCNAAETDYHGDAVLEPEIILSDLTAIFHPSLLSGHKAVYFKRVEEGRGEY